ncbi:MAG: RCC1 domain-containing protein [Myxococcota bacterium]
MRLVPLFVWVLVGGCLSVAQVDPIEDDGVVEPPDTGAPQEPDPDPVVELEDLIVDLSVARGSACVTRASGSLECWGEGPLTNVMGQESVDHGEPKDIVSTSGLIEQGCMLHADGGVSCWGFNHHLQLGGAIGRNEESTVPLRLPHVSNAVALSSGHHHVCVLTDQDQAACWGEPYSNSLGPQIFGSEEPVGFDLPDAVIVDVSASMEQVCALGDSGRLWCWGSLGLRNGPLSDLSGNPIQIPIDADLVGVSAGWQGGCAWDAAGAAWCWGSPLGAEEPVRLDLDPVSDVVVSWQQICTLDAGDGGVWCVEPVPDEVAAQTDFTHVAVGDTQVCAARRDGHVACWFRGELTWHEVEGAL